MAADKEKGYTALYEQDEESVTEAEEIQTEILEGDYTCYVKNPGSQQETEYSVVDGVSTVALINVDRSLLESCLNKLTMTGLALSH